MNVLIVVMPFAAIRPAMGPSLLAGHLKRAGVHTQVRYLSMDFVKRLGWADYDYIADRAPTQSLAGDWVFSGTLFGERPLADAAYAETFRERFPAHASGLSALGRARKHAAQFIDACMPQVDWVAYDVIGFTSSFTQHVASLALAKRIKTAHPKVQIVFGGANCEDVMGLTLHRTFSFVDFVCSGEADVSFPRLVSALAQGQDPSKIAGVIARRGGITVYSNLHPERVTNLDELPYPNFDDYMEQHTAAFPAGRSARARILLESSRGCWWGQKHHCTFCGLNGNSMNFRAKSAARLLNEIEELQKRYSAEHVEMVDNILDSSYFATVLPELKRRKLKLVLFYETKANLRKDQIQLLRDAGVMAIQPGIESFSTNVLKLMRKGTSAAQNVQLLKWCAEAGIEVCWNLLYGFPGESRSDYLRMASVLDSLTHLEPPRGFGSIRLDRFSPNFNRPAEFGLCNVRPDRSYGLIYNLPLEVLSDLAYYFEHDYVDGRDPSAYAADSIDAARRWCGSHEPGRLVYADHGDSMAIWDLRRSATRRLTILHGLQRKVYLYCDERRTRQGIMTAFSMTAGDVDTVMEPLLANRLMLRVDSQYVSLALNLAAVAKPLVAPSWTKDTVFF